MVTTPAAAPEPQPPVNHLGQMFGALFSTKATFEDIAKRPSWVAPIVLFTLLGIVAGALIAQRTDWRSFFQRQNENNSRLAQAPPEQKERVLETQLKFAPISSYAFGALGPVLVVLVLTLVYWGAFNLFNGAGLNYGASFAITAHAYVPSLIASVLVIITIFLKQPGEIDPEHLLATNLGAFLADDAPKWLQSLGSSLELFWIWFLALLAIGFAAANPKKIKPASAFGVVFGLWLLWVLIKVGWVAL